MASAASKRPRSTPQPSAALARLEMLASVVLDAYGASDSFDKDGEAKLEPAPDAEHTESRPPARRQKVPRSPKTKERSTHGEASSSSSSPSSPSLAAVAPAVPPGAKAHRVAAHLPPPASVVAEKHFYLRDLPPPPINVLCAALVRKRVRGLWRAEAGRQAGRQVGRQAGRQGQKQRKRDREREQERERQAARDKWRETGSERNRDQGRYQG